MKDQKTEAGWVTLERKDATGVITFFHPSHNSLPGKLLAALSEKIQSAGQDPLIRVILLQSSGNRTFCAGASFDELIAIEDLEGGLEFFMGFARVINDMRKCPKFILGRIQGKAVGGGVGLAAATDFCIATKAASIKLSELAVGIGPFVVGPAVDRKLGKAAMTQLAIDANSWQDADWAQNKGLYQEVYEDINSMDQRLHDLLLQLSNYSPDAMKALKLAAWEGTENWDTLLAERAAVSGKLILSLHAKKAIEAFKQKNT